MTDGPLLWYANRGSGFALLALLTAVVVIGVLATRGSAGGVLPRFVVQALHRNLGLLTAALLAAHVVTAVVDEYVDIRWWHALVPVGATYQPLWLALGTLALDLVLAVVVTSLLRDRLGHRAWRVLHLSTYPAWALSVVHGLGIGTDTGSTAATAVYVVAVGAVGVAAVVRTAGLIAARTHPGPAEAPRPVVLGGAR